MLRMSATERDPVDCYLTTINRLLRRSVPLAHDVACRPRDSRPSAIEGASAFPGLPSDGANREPGCDDAPEGQRFARAEPAADRGNQLLGTGIVLHEQWIGYVIALRQGAVIEEMGVRTTEQGIGTVSQTQRKH